MSMEQILSLSEAAPGSLMGAGPEYPWGGLYGGQIVAQGLLAAGVGVDPEYLPHSVRAYFIRRGRQAEPVTYEVDPIRDGRSFCTRRVVAHQGGQPIGNLEASFQRTEPSEDIETIAIDTFVPQPDEGGSESWSEAFDRVTVDSAVTAPGVGRATAWIRSTPLPEGSGPLLNAAALAFVSDDLPTDAVIRSHPVSRGRTDLWDPPLFSASLDHTIWFHRPADADRWQLHDFRCHSYVGGRGLALGHIHTLSGTHVATVAQEVLLRVDS
ncbi:MAG: thioesterase family protein [Microthrixaceae bacterium]|nr:thioesterase family protein [Microthrixaceae bacterium]